MKLKANKTKGPALEGQSISLVDFKKEITKAEKGPFYTTEEAKKLVSEWGKKKGTR